MAEGDTLPNALVGAVVTVVGMAFLPFSPLLGGAVAGYLEGGDRRDGLSAGLVSGLISLVPGIAIAFLVLAFLGVVTLGGAGEAAVFGVFWVGLVVLVLLFEGLYTVGLSVAGGWLGNYVKYDTDVEF